MSSNSQKMLVKQNGGLNIPLVNTKYNTSNATVSKTANLEAYKTEKYRTRINNLLAQNPQLVSKYNELCKQYGVSA